MVMRSLRCCASILAAQFLVAAPAILRESLAAVWQSLCGATGSWAANLGGDREEELEEEMQEFMMSMGYWTGSTGLHGIEYLLGCLCSSGHERSFWFGLCYIVTSLSILDEYSNNVLDMPEGTCFPRLTYRKKTSRMSSSASFSRPGSFKNPPSRTGSVNGPMLELKPLELVDALFKECQLHGEVMALKWVITRKDIEDAMNNKASGGVISISLPAYCILQALLRSANSNSAGIFLIDSVTEITTSNRPSDMFFEWFLNPAQFLYTNHRAYDILVLIGHACGDEEKGGKKENLLHYFYVVAGGLAGETPHKISAVMTGLARLAYEFSDLISAAYSVLPSTYLLMQRKNKEIIKIVEGVGAKSPAEGLQTHLRGMVEGLLNWQDNTRSLFKAKMLLEMLVKKCGLAAVKDVMPEEHMKLLTNIRELNE
ncbi:hypothetical protein ACS0TY_029515 [Phlomoides rotata]